MAVFPLADTEDLAAPDIYLTWLFGGAACEEESGAGGVLEHTAVLPDLAHCQGPTFLPWEAAGVVVAAPMAAWWVGDDRAGARVPGGVAIDPPAVKAELFIDAAPLCVQNRDTWHAFPKKQHRHYTGFKCQYRLNHLPEPAKSAQSCPRTHV